LKKKVKRLRNSYNEIGIQVVVGVLLLVCVLVSFSCSTTKGKEITVTYEPEMKKGEKDGAQIDSLKIELVKRYPNGDFLVSYSIQGRITEEYWHKSMVLRKIRLIEKEDSTSLYDKQITLTPVLCSFFGIAAMWPRPFHIKKEYLIKNSPDKSIRKVLFSSGDKEYLLELP